jgi:DegV family protein with EDD domain
MENLLKVQVVTDSTSDLPPDLVEEFGITIVPIYLRFGNITYRDGIDISNHEFYSMLSTSPIHPATSQPNPEDFISVYRDCCEKSAGIISIHISSRISGTFNSAMIARKTFSNSRPIEVIDSKYNSAGLGLVVLAAARLAKAGASLNEVVNEARKAISEIRMFGMFETMIYLARSGRVSKTIASASQFLHVMPLLTFHDGEILRAGLVRSVTQGIDRISSYFTKNAPFSEIFIVHSESPNHAGVLKNRLSSLISKERIAIMKLGTALGVHGGPGVLLAAARRTESI